MFTDFKLDKLISLIESLLTHDDSVQTHLIWTPRVHILKTSMNREVIIQAKSPTKVLVEYFQSHEEWIASGGFSDLIASKILYFKE